MQSRSTKAFTAAELLVVCAICLTVLLTFGDAVSNAKYNARAASCKANFRQIKVAMQTYQAAHGGKMPTALKALFPITHSQSVFLCSYSGTVYDYRFLAQPKASDIICWDSHPHRPMHSVFVWLNRPNRNVLRADGQVTNLPEDEFQRLRLSGQRPALS